MRRFKNSKLLIRSTLINPICCRESSSSFNIDTVTQNYEQRTEFASANYRKAGSTFRMVLPPPNVTGKLHLGHALTVAIEDSICRHERNKGNKAEWIPGFDHAGIATQAVVEKMLAKKGKYRKNMTRKEFIEECQKWSELCSSEIRQQMSRMGASLDWNQSYYTLDNEFSSAVNRAFCILYKEDLINRGKRIVHWCPSLSSTVSSQEVDMIEVPSDGNIIIPGIDGSSKKRTIKCGKMHLVRYKILDSNDGFIEVGTTRPETLYADIAIAVNPNDPRYSQLIGKYVESPVIKGRKLLIIADEGVSIEKGTGAVKITPYHDPLDYEIWQRNEDIIGKVDNKECIDENGKMINSSFDGMDRFDARDKVIEYLISNNLYGGIGKHTNPKVNICSRTGDIIEPRLTEQWFLNCSQMFKESIKSIESGKIKIMPEYQEHRLIDWFSNDEPWCLSRQLLWGHQIPAYRNKNKSDEWIVTENRQIAEEKYGKDLIQDEDVLDTWFSSSLVPLVKNGWMENKQIQIPPLNLMETGWDISGFWVARMIALNIKLTGEVPFGKVVLHGLVRDGEGRKMSKSLGNVIDPLDILDGISNEKMVERIRNSSLTSTEIETAVKDLNKKYPKGIEKCGPDALRFALLKYDILSMDVSIDISSASSEGLKFCNKLWNLAAYYDKLAEKCDVIRDVDSNRLVDEWIMARLSSVVSQVDNHMSNHSLHLALTTLHQFVTSDICDVYLETTKEALWTEDFKQIAQIRSTLQRVLQPTLVQLSAFMPFVSEYLYERIFAREPGSILFDVVKPSLFIFHQNEELEQAMKLIKSVISAVRSLRQNLELSQKLVFTGFLEIDNRVELSDRELLKLSKEVTSICGLNVEKIRRNTSHGEVEKQYIACPIQGHNACLLVKISEDHKEKFIESLKKQHEKVKTRKEQYEKKVESYENICNKTETKKSSIERVEKKREHAQKVVRSTEEEMNRLQILISNQS